MKKALIAILIVLVFIAVGGFLFGRWYDSHVDRSGWIEDGGVYAYQDFYGNRVTGWQTLGENTYYFFSDGAMATGWQTLEGKTCYFGSNGILRTGFQELEGKVYGFDPQGNLYTGWQTLENGKYYFSNEGVMAAGWTDLDGKRYHFADNGVMETGWIDLGGTTYCLGEDGVLLTGWQTLDEQVYYLDDSGSPVTGEQTLPARDSGEFQEFYFGETGIMQTGFLDFPQGRRYYTPDGSRGYGWQEVGDKRYYLGEEGLTQSGWLTLGEYSYYLQSDGSASVGETVIDGETYFFTPKGIMVILVNSTHPIPDYYQLDLVPIVKWFQMQRVALEPMKQMLADCEAAGNSYYFHNSYRSQEQQTAVLKERIEEYQKQYDLSYEDARAKALTIVALPGTSEHQLGLAADIEGEDAHAWLAEHCWEYGYILRYPEGKSDITGISTEPWHFRYVGKEVSMDMKDTGLCLEEYLGVTD